MALTDNLISYWKLDEASGNAVDSHGSNTLTDTNTVGSGTGKINGGRDFTSASQEALVCADNASLSLGDNDFFSSFWFKADTVATNQHLVGKFQNVTAGEWRVVLLASSLTFYLRTGASSEATVTWSAAISTATWYHVVVWHTASTNVLRITVNDGTPVAGSAYTGAGQDSAVDFSIGRRSGGTDLAYDGIIDEVGFWKGRAPTSGEITQLYNGGAGLSYDSFGGGGGGGGSAVPKILLAHGAFFGDGPAL